MTEQEILHRQSKEAWEKRSVELEAANKKYLVKINELFTEKDALELGLKTKRNTAHLVTINLGGRIAFEGLETIG